MVRHYYPDLFKDDPEWRDRAQWAADITWEFTEYLVDGLGITDIGAKLPPTKVAFHQACHGYRLLHLDHQARQLAEAVDGVTVTDLHGADQCCGFGGLFAVKMPEISGAMLKDKVDEHQRRRRRRDRHGRRKLPDADERRAEPQREREARRPYRRFSGARPEGKRNIK